MKLIAFLSILRKSRGLMVLVVAASILSGVSSTGLIALLHRALEPGGRGGAGLIWGFMGLCLLLPLTRVVAQTLLAHLAERAVYEMRMKMARQILATPLRQLEEIGIPSLLATLTGDVFAITNAFTNLPFFFMQIAIVIGCLVYLALLSWLPFLLFIGILAFAVMTIQLTELPARRSLGQAREETDALYNHLSALTEGVKELKLHRERRRAFLEEVFAVTADSLRRHNVRGAAIYAASRGWTHLLFFAVLGAVTFALPALTSMSQDTITGYALTILYMSFPLDIAMGLFPTMTSASISAEKVASLRLSLAEGDGQSRALAAKPAARHWDTLELAGVTYTYTNEAQGASFTLGPIDLRLHSSELVFITGGNGTGKTTLAKILIGLYAPEQGEIRFNGEPITERNREEYRQNFSALFADFYLFETLLGLDTGERDMQADHYLRQLQLDKKVQIENGRLSTLDLSQGQRKRLALLTAYLEDRPIYLFDEWAADQDPLFREVFYYKLLPELKARGKTIIVISHDDRYYHLADRLIKLDYGRLEYDRTAASRSVEVAEITRPLEAKARPE